MRAKLVVGVGRLEGCAGRVFGGGALEGHLRDQLGRTLESDSVPATA